MLAKLIQVIQVEHCIGEGTIIETLRKIHEHGGRTVIETNQGDGDAS